VTPLGIANRESRGGGWVLVLDGTKLSASPVHNCVDYFQWLSGVNFSNHFRYARKQLTIVDE
jgi:hypothetical protein